MSYEEFRQTISRITNVPLVKIQQDSSFRDDLDIDSLQMVNLIVELTSRLGIEKFNVQSNEDFITVGNLYQAVMRGEDNYE